MKRLLIYLGLVLSLASASAQEFLTNEDFIFGVGDTDSAAVIALSTSIRVAVTSDITYSVRETKKTISEDFSKNIGLSSSIIITNSRQYIDKNGNYYESVDTLKRWESMLQNRSEFYKISKSFIVSMKYIEHYEEKYVEMYKSNQKLPISRRNASAFKKEYYRYIMSS